MRDANTRAADDTSDSDDQFSDARSVPATPNIRSPTPKAIAKQSSRRDEISQDDEDAGADESDAPQIDAVMAASNGHKTEDTAEEDEAIDDDDANAGDDFGDDFDDFEEGGGGDDGFDDFDDDDFAQPEPAPVPEAQLTPQHKPLPFVSTTATRHGISSADMSPRLYPTLMALVLTRFSPRRKT